MCVPQVLSSNYNVNDRYLRLNHDLSLLTEYWYHRVGGKLNPVGALGRVGSEPAKSLGGRLPLKGLAALALNTFGLPP